MSAVDAGWYKDDGAHDAGNTNYISGNVSSAEYRNFFVFDLSGIDETITGATLSFSANSTSGSPDYQLTSTSTSVVDLVSTELPSSANGIAKFSELGTGTLYGSVTSAGPGSLDIELSAAALSDLNLATGLFALGGRVTSADPDTWIFNGSNIAQITGLTVTTVPVPAAVWLFGSALGLLGWVRRKRA